MHEDIDVDYDTHPIKAPKQARWHTCLWPACLGPGCFCCKIQKRSHTFIGYDPVGKFQRAAGMGDVASVERFINSHKYSVNDCDRRGRTSLHYACAHNHPDVVALLLSKNASIDMRDDEGRTPLIKAIQFENVECIFVLLKQGADPHIIDFSGITALHHAVSRGNTTIVSHLLEYNANIEAKTQDGLTPYDLALLEDKHLMAEFLIQKGAKAQPVVDSNREASQKHSESMTNVFKMNEGEDEITECTSSSSLSENDDIPQPTTKDTKSLFVIKERRKRHRNMNNSVEKMEQTAPREPEMTLCSQEEPIPGSSQEKSCIMPKATRQENMEGDFELRKQDADHHMTAHRGITAVHHDVSRDNKTSANKLLESNVDTDAKKEGKLKRLLRHHKNKRVKKDQPVPRESEMNVCSHGEPIADELSAYNNPVLFEEKHQVPAFLRKDKANAHSVVESNSDDSFPKKPEQIKKKHVTFNKVLEEHHSTDPMPSFSGARPPRKLKPILKMSDYINTAHGRIKQQNLVWHFEDHNVVSPFTTVDAYSFSVIKATRLNTMEGISELLKLYVDPHMTDLSENTAQHDAISRDNETSVSELVESNVDIDDKKEDKLTAHNLALFEEKHQDAHCLRNKGAVVHSVVESNRKASLGKHSKSMTNLFLISEGEDEITEQTSLFRFSENPDVPASITEDKDRTCVTKVEEKKSEDFLHESYDHDIAMVQPTVPIETTLTECVSDMGDSVEASEKNDCDHDTTPELTPSSGDTLDSSMDVDPIVVPTNPNNHASHTRITYNAMCTMAELIGVLIIASSVFCVISLFIMMKRIERRLRREK